MRLAKSFRESGINATIEADLFNVLNANTALSRLRNVASPNFQRLTQNLSPRILRIGIRVGF